MNAVFYDGDGRILRVQSVPPDWSGSPEPGESLITTEDSCGDDTHYVDLSSPPQIVAKGASSAALDKTSVTADGVDTATLSNLPASSVVFLSSGNVTTEQPVADGTLVLTFIEEGSFSIAIDSIEELMFHAVIEAA